MNANDIWLIAGLGNPEAKYDGTRHNAGFAALDSLAGKWGISVSKTKFQGLWGQGEVDGHKVVLLKPLTYMNLSGNAVRYWMNEKKIPLENILVVVDDLSLPFGQLRMRPGGSEAGHNGLKHISSVLGTQQYARLRFGIGNDFPRGGQVDFVLGEFTEEDLKTMDERLELAGEMVKSFALSGIQFTMNHFNKK